MATDLTTVSFAVPSHLALDFQTRAFTLLSELTSGTPAARRPLTGDASDFTPRSSKEVQGLDVWQLQPWSEDDTDRARWVAESLPHAPRAVLTLLCRAADRWVSGTDIAEELGFDHGSKSVPPSFKSMANRCRRADRRPMWDYDSQNGYRVPARTAALFQAVFAEQEQL